MAEEKPKVRSIRRRKLRLPPMVESINDGKVTWKKLCAINHRTLGGFLSAHLIIEHYLTEALKRTVQGKEKLNWDSARLTFSQKVNLFCVNDDFRARFVPCLKHLNKLRNNFSHDLTFRLSDTDLTPFLDYLKWTYPIIGV